MPTVIAAAGVPDDTGRKAVMHPSPRDRGSPPRLLPALCTACEESIRRQRIQPVEGPALQDVCLYGSGGTAQLEPSSGTSISSVVP